MPITQIIGITLIIMAFLATVKVIHDLISTDQKIKNYTKQIKEIDQRLKAEYHMMTGYKVHKLNMKKQDLELKLSNLKNTK